jgi:hypothetical protein
MRQGEKQVLVEVLREKQGPFLAAGRAYVKPATREGAEVFMPAFRIRASDAGHALPALAV